MEWTSNGQGAPRDLRAVPKVSVERYQFSCLRRNLGGAKDELGIGVGLQEDEGDLVLDGLGSDAGGIAVVVVDVRFGVAQGNASHSWRVASSQQSIYIFQHGRVATLNWSIVR